MNIRARKEIPLSDQGKCSSVSTCSSSGGSACSSGPPPKEDGGSWAIIDLRTGRPYLQITWTEEQARWELAELLHPYPEGHEWRTRLVVREWKKSLRKGGSVDWDAKLASMGFSREEGDGVGPANRRVG